MGTLDEIEFDKSESDEVDESETSEIERVTANILRSKRLRKIRARLKLPNIPEPFITHLPVDVSGFVTTNTQEAAESYRELAVEFYS